MAVYKWYLLELNPLAFYNDIYRNIGPYSNTYELKQDPLVLYTMYIGPYGSVLMELMSV